jgi:hypothetical protein
MSNVLQPVMLNLDVAQQIAAKQAYEEERGKPVPDANYSFFIEKVETTSTKSGGARSSITLIITEGPLQGKKVFHGINIQNSNPKAVEIAQQELAAYAYALGWSHLQCAEQLAGQYVDGKTKTEKGQDGYEDKSSIKDVAPYGSLPKSTVMPTNGLPGPGAQPNFSQPNAAPQQQPMINNQYNPGGAPQQAPQQVPQQAPQGYAPPQQQAPQQYAQQPQGAPQGQPQQYQQQPQQYAPQQQQAPQQYQQAPVQQQPAPQQYAQQPQQYAPQQQQQYPAAGPAPAAQYEQQAPVNQAPQQGGYQQSMPQQGYQPPQQQQGMPTQQSAPAPAQQQQGGYQQAPVQQQAPQPQGMPQGGGSAPWTGPGQ